MRPHTRGPAPLAALVPILVVGMLRMAAEGGARNLVNVYLDAALTVPTAQIGVLMGAGQLLAVPSALAMPLLAARWGHYRTITWGVLATALSTLPLALVPHPTAAALSLMGMGALVAVVRPAFMIYSQRLVAPAWRGTMSAATNVAAGIGAGMMLLAGGWAIAALGYRRFFLIPAALFAAAGVFFGVWFGRLGD